MSGEAYDLRRHPRLRPPKSRVYRDGHCCWCGKALTGRRTSWCSDRCVNEYRSFEPARLRQACWDRDRGFCRKCRRDLAVTGERWEADHKIPVVEGGLNCLANLRTLCLQCHKIETAKLAKRLADRRSGRTGER